MWHSITEEAWVRRASWVKSAHTDDLVEGDLKSLASLSWLLLRAPSSNSFKKLFIWLRWVLVVALRFLVVACRIFTCSMWGPVPQVGIEPGPHALKVWSLSHWTMKEVHIINLIFMGLKPLANMRTALCLQLEISSRVVLGPSHLLNLCLSDLITFLGFSRCISSFCKERQVCIIHKWIWFYCLKLSQTNCQPYEKIISGREGVPPGHIPKLRLLFFNKCSLTFNWFIIIS